MMKAVVLSFLFALGVILSDSARADFFNPFVPPTPAWFPVQAQVVVTPFQATVVVQNLFAAPFACQGQAWGQMASGYQGLVAVAIPAVYPGTFGYAYLTPFYGDYFVAANAQIWCLFL